MAKSFITDFSTTAASNTDLGGLDSTGTTGVVKSGDNYVRSLMAMLAMYYDDMGAVNTVAGTANAITITAAEAWTAYGTGANEIATGTGLLFKAGAVNTSTVTVAVNGLTAKAIRKLVNGSDVGLDAGDIRNGQRYGLLYDSTANSAAGAWILLDQPEVNKGADVATASTMVLNTATGLMVDITGTTTVTAITLAEGAIKIGRATGAHQYTASASLIINGSTSTNYTTTAEDILLYEGRASSVVRLWVLYSSALGTPSSGVATNLTSIPAGQLTGTVADARLSSAMQALIAPSGWNLGATIFGYRNVATAATLGDLVAGSQIEPCNSDDVPLRGSALSGTACCMGNIGTGSGDIRVTCWARNA